MILLCYFSVNERLSIDPPLHFLLLVAVLTEVAHVRAYYFKHGFVEMFPP